MPLELKPHGTEAAARRHYRLGEKPCEACRGAASTRHAERNGADPYWRFTPAVPPRNGLPDRQPYRYGATRPSWALAAIAAAEAKYGRPPAQLDTDIDFAAG
jgi:hypothetical protein